MNAFEVMTNPTKLRKLAQTALFLPAIITVKRDVETEMKSFSAAEKRASALGLVERLVVQLARRSYLPVDLQEGLQEVIGDLYDSVAAATK